MKSDSSRKRLLAGVLSISNDRVARVFQLDTDLMFAAGFKLDFQQLLAGRLVDRIVAERSLLFARDSSGMIRNGFHAMAAFVFIQAVDYSSRRWLESTRDQGQVAFVDRAAANLVGKS